MRMEFFFDNIVITTGFLVNKDILWIDMPNEIEYRNYLRQLIANAKWSSSKKLWFVTDTKSNRLILNYKPKRYTPSLILKKIHPINKTYFTQFVNLLRLKAYSESTIKTYCTELAQFLYILDHVSADMIDSERLRAYLLYCITDLGLSENQIHSRLNALKFFYEQLFNWTNFYYEIPRPKKKEALPKVFSTKEIKRIFEVTTNLKHLMMLKMAYGLGLRVSEIVDLKINNIDSDRMLVLIQNSKGKKDRYVPLPNSILNELRTYYIKQKPMVYLFENEKKQPMAIRSVQAIFKLAKDKANIKKTIGIHGLRHSYATHLLEYGTDMSVIQKLLGHSNVKTTEVYAKVSTTFIAKVKSPLDEL